MYIVVSADGKARIAKFFISRPNIVRVRNEVQEGVDGGREGMNGEVSEVGWVGR